MQQIENGKLVSFKFQMFSTDGDLLGGTQEEPLSYIHGHTPIDPPGLEEHLYGKTLGYSGEVTIPPEKAYGLELLPPEQSMDTIPVSQFGDTEVLPGMMFMANIEGKGELPITVMKVENENAIVYFGHPLAGQHLRFVIDVIDVRDPTQEEKAQFGL